MHSILTYKMEYKATGCIRDRNIMNGREYKAIGCIDRDKNAVNNMKKIKSSFLQCTCMHILV